MKLLLKFHFGLALQHGAQPSKRWDFKSAKEGASRECSVSPAKSSDPSLLCFTKKYLVLTWQNAGSFR